MDITNNLINLISNDTTKMKSLQDANEKLHINNSLNKIIFVYSKPKVGSTSLVTSLRIFASKYYNIIHIHDDQMLKVLGNIENITVNEIILYNKIIGKDVYVIDIYRSPIERKISTFFEKIDTYHFNADISKLADYSIDCIIERFNKIFPHIGIGDNFLDIYNIEKPNIFPHSKKYIYIEQNGIKYIKLRLKDVDLWENILYNELKIKLKIIPDYETNNKPVKIIYNLFKRNYKLPLNHFEHIQNCVYLNYYYSPQEIEEYLNIWNNKIIDHCIPFTTDEYKLYDYICSQNNNYSRVIHLKHYLDEGCLCKACQIKRNRIVFKLMNGQPITERIFHEEAKNELIENRLKNFNKAIFLSKKRFIQNKNQNQNKMPNMKHIANIR